MDDQSAHLSAQAPFSLQTTASNPQRIHGGLQPRYVDQHGKARQFPYEVHHGYHLQDGPKHRRVDHFAAETTPQVSHAQSFWEGQPHTVGMQNQDIGGLPRADSPLKSEEVERSSAPAAQQEAIDVDALVPLSTGHHVPRGSQEYFKIRSLYAACIKKLAGYATNSKLAKEFKDAAILASLQEDPIKLKERHEGSMSGTQAWRRVAERVVTGLAADVEAAASLHTAFPMTKEEMDGFQELVLNRNRRHKHLKAQHYQRKMEVIMKDLDGYLRRLAPRAEQ